MIRKKIEARLESFSEVKDKLQKCKLPEEYKQYALENMTNSTSYKKKFAFSLKLHPDLTKKIKEKGLRSGFDMGVCPDGYFIHTHRARSKAYPTPSGITIKDIKFINSTG